MANHPHSRIYAALRPVVEVEGYFLESAPCLACSVSETAYVRMDMEALKAEVKYAHNRILLKFTATHAIKVGWGGRVGGGVGPLGPTTVCLFFHLLFFFFFFFSFIRVIHV